MTKHILTLLDLPKADAHKILLRAKEIKDSDIRTDQLKGKSVILIFEKSSTRTRVSFEIGVHHLGGQTLFLTPNDCQLGRSEPIKDTARVLSRYADGIVMRTFEQEKLEILAEYGSIPVINALSDDYHPCQIMSDVLTMYERTPDLENVTAAWIGDGNNMAHSLINGSALFGYTLNLACPKGYRPNDEIVQKALKMGAKLNLTDDPSEAVQGVDYIHTDVWASMGQEDEQAKREKAFKGYQVDATLMSKAASGCKFMHCLPAHRGEEVSEEVFEGPASIVFDQAENRLHAQKAMMEWAFQK